MDHLAISGVRSCVDNFPRKQTWKIQYPEISRNKCRREIKNCAQANEPRKPLRKLVRIRTRTTSLPVFNAAQTSPWLYSRNYVRILVGQNAYESVKKSQSEWLPGRSNLLFFESVWKHVNVKTPKSHSHISHIISNASIACGWESTTIEHDSHDHRWSDNLCLSQMLHVWNIYTYYTLGWFRG